MAKYLYDGEEGMKIDVTPALNEIKGRLERLRKLAPYIEKFEITDEDLKFLLQGMPCNSGN